MIKEIDGLNEQERAQFKKWVEEAKNRAIILVHPFFEGFCPGRTSISNEQREKLVFPENERQARTPLVIFESYREIGHARSWLERLKRKKNFRRKIIFVLTEWDEPTPKTMGWAKLIDELASLSIERAFVCGGQLKTFPVAKAYFDNIISAWIDKADIDVDPQVEEDMKNEVRGMQKKFEEVAALEKREFAQIFEQYVKRKEAKGEMETGGNRKKKGINFEEYIEKRADIGKGNCVGNAYNELVRSQKFKRVRILPNYCR